jgi:hypothetical protein
MSPLDLIFQVQVRIKLYGEPTISQSCSFEMGGVSGRVNVSSTTWILVGEVCSPIFNTTKFDYRLWVWCLVPQPRLSNASTSPTPILFSCKVTKRLFERACNFELPGVSVGFYICFLETTFSHSDGTDSVPESVCAMEDLRRSGKDTSKVYHLLLVTNLKTGVLQ